MKEIGSKLGYSIKFQPVALPAQKAHFRQKKEFDRIEGSPLYIFIVLDPKVDFFVQFTRQITALTFFAILISLIFLSKYIVLYALSRPIDNLTFK